LFAGAGFGLARGQTPLGVGVVGDEAVDLVGGTGVEILGHVFAPTDHGDEVTVEEIALPDEGLGSDLVLGFAGLECRGGCRR